MKRRNAVSFYNFSRVSLIEKFSSPPLLISKPLENIKYHQLCTQFFTESASVYTICDWPLFTVVSRWDDKQMEEFNSSVWENRRWKKNGEREEGDIESSKLCNCGEVGLGKN